MEFSKCRLIKNTSKISYTKINVRVERRTKPILWNLVNKYNLFSTKKISTEAENFKSRSRQSRLSKKSSKAKTTSRKSLLDIPKLYLQTYKSMKLFTRCLVRIQQKHGGSCWALRRRHRRHPAHSSAVSREYGQPAR